MIINTFKSVKHTKDFSTIYINDWLNTIQIGTYSNKIQEIRPHGKDSEYFKTEKIKLPCVTYNFLYNNSRADHNIYASTQLLFIDLDSLSFELKESLKSKIFACYKSISGTGYHIIVKVSNVPYNIDSISFFDFTISIANDLGIQDLIDCNSIKRSQCSIVSYDPDLFFNEYSITYEFKKSYLYLTNLSINNNNNNTYVSVPKVTFSNIHDVANVDNGFKVNKDGWDYFECKIPFKVKNGSRQSFLSSYCNNYILLNKHLNQQSVYKTMLKVNQLGCINPLTENEIYKIVDYKFKNKETLKPIMQKKKRKIVFAKNSEYTLTEKKQIVSKVVGEIRTENKLKQLQEIIFDWNFEMYGKITQKKIYENFDIGKRFVKENYSKFINKNK
jgi:glycerol-3-phosphate cytidylyltransferase-like family protein